MSKGNIAAEARAQYGEKVERGIFKPVARLLHVEPEDRMQEGLGLGYEQYVNKAEKTGEFMDDPLCVHVVKLRATDFSRHLVRGGQKKRDALDQRNYIEGRVAEVLRLDGLPDQDDEEFDGEGDRVLVGMAVALSANPVSKIVSAIDLEEWLDQLDAQDRELLELRSQGFTLAEIAGMLDWHISDACSRCRQLGRELAARAGLPINPVRRGRKARPDSCDAQQ